ncbi:Wzz/FepE/Etk N-terminal domain-containing protein [Microbacterium sp. 179-I 3D3 NHS]|uniref:Wzz/FepE/Etk N-terminal domain-containing protein n=1 Tax=Microbacterium sp. 179-I 3D3 NHS TaxID=3142382 RepID=UPI00399F6084
MAAQWTLDDLYRRVMQSWFVLVGTILAFMLAGAAIFAVFPQTYTAQAQHTVEPISVLSSGSSFNTVNMETERVVATSTAVLQRASDTLGDVSVSTLRDATVIEVPRNSQVLMFQVTASSGTKAAAWANALAEAYGEQRTANARTVLEQTSAELDDAIQKLQDLLITQQEGSNTRAATQLQLQALLDQQARLTSTPLFSGILVTPADIPGSSNRPSIVVFIAAGLFLGMLLGGIAALLTSRFRTHRAEDRAAEDAASSGGEPDHDEPAGEKPLAAAPVEEGPHADAPSDEEPRAAALPEQEPHDDEPVDEALDADEPHADEPVDEALGDDEPHDDEPALDDVTAGPIDDEPERVPDSSDPGSSDPDESDPDEDDDGDDAAWEGERAPVKGGAVT